MKIATVIVTYNGMKWIDQCLKSLVGQSEIIIVDNNSSDNTINFIKDTYPDIKLFAQNENIGFGKANNIGISHALKNGADFIFLLNQDTVIEKDTVVKLEEVATANPDFGIISPIHSNGDNTSLDLSFLYYINNGCPDFISDSVLDKKKKVIYPIKMVNAAAWFLPKKTFEIVGGFDPLFFLYGEDDNFCQRVLYHNLKIGITPSTVIKHDSGNNYKVDFPKGSKEYYNNFLNRIKVKFADVNSQDFKKINKLKRHFLKEVLLSLVKFKFNEFRINTTKYKLIDKKSLEMSVLQNIQVGKKYLL
jgi:GT2 family glycosyltransferase